MKKIVTGFCFLVAMAVLFAWIPTTADAQSSYYTSRGCTGCHAATPTTCAGCHGHGVHSSSAKSNLNLTGTTNKTSYAPGETVSVTIAGGYRSGWVRAILYDQNMNELGRSTGPTGEGGGASFPITLTAPAPTAPGTYTWNVSWYGNINDSGSAFFGPRWTPDPNNANHGEEIVSTNSFTVAGASAPSSKSGVFLNGVWYLDMNGNGAWNGAPTDGLRPDFGMTGSLPVTGDWDGNGTTNIGIYHNGYWYLDLNGDGAWNGAPTDTLYTDFSIAGSVPVSGNWDGTGKTEIGLFYNGSWYLDYNGNGMWDGTPTDRLYTDFGSLPGTIPVTGDWNNTGTTKIGIYYNGSWYLDMNGNGVWNGTPTDALYPAFGIAGSIPVTGDWNGTGTAKIGIYYNGVWYLDLNGNGVWDGTPTDTIYVDFGTTNPDMKPVTGKW